MGVVTIQVKNICIYVDQCDCELEILGELETKHGNKWYNTHLYTHKTFHKKCIHIQVMWWRKYLKTVPSGHNVGVVISCMYWITLNVWYFKLVIHIYIFNKYPLHTIYANICARVHISVFFFHCLYTSRVSIIINININNSSLFLNCV